MNKRHPPPPFLNSFIYGFFCLFVLRKLYTASVKFTGHLRLMVRNGTMIPVDTTKNLCECECYFLTCTRKLSNTEVTEQIHAASVNVAFLSQPGQGRTGLN